MAKTAVITGGASGIGKQTAIRLAQLAENIVVVDRNIDGAEELIENLQKAGNGAKAISLDVTDFEAVKKAAPNVKENKRRDGSYDYYLSEPVRDNDAKGVGPFIWASLEYEKK